MITKAEQEETERQEQYEQAEQAVTEMGNLQRDLCRQYEQLISWSELYDSASFETKKMIVNWLMKRVEVFRGYRLQIEFNFDLMQFFYGLDFLEKKQA